MKSLKDNWVQWAIVGGGLALALWLTFGYKDPARNGTPEQKAEASYEMRAGKMQN